MASLTKNLKPKTKNFFFHCRLEDLLSFKGLNNFLAQLPSKLRSC